MDNPLWSGITAKPGVVENVGDSMCGFLVAWDNFC